MMETLKINQKRYRLLWICILISLCFHITALVFLIKKPLLVHPYLHFLLSKASRNSEEFSADGLEKNRILDEVLNEITMVPLQEQKPFDAQGKFVDLVKDPLLESVAEISLETPPANEISAEPVITTQQLVIPQDMPQEYLLDLSENSQLAPMVTLDKSANEEIATELTQISSLFEEEIEEIQTEDQVAYYPDQFPQSTDDGLKASLASYKESALPEASLIKVKVPSSREKSTERFPLAMGKPQPDSQKVLQDRKISSERTLGTYLLPEDLVIESWDADFHVDVQLMPRKDGNGYLFSLKLEPKENLVDSLKQNFYFLIDRSNSVSKHRYNVFKRAVVRALGALQSKDTFNIYIFDKKIARLSDKNLPVSDASLRLAEDFLEKEEHSRLFAATDIYTLLDKIVPTNVPENDVNTAILISDGDTLLDIKKQREVINKWTNKNHGKIALYTAAVGQDNNLALLDLVSTFNKGHLLYSDTHASFPRKLTKLVYDLRSPIAKDLIITATTSVPESNVLIYPPASRLPNFYTHEPFVIVGTMDKLCDITLTIQGKHKNQWLNLEKQISFTEVKKGGRALEKRYALQQAYVSYERFLKEGKPSYLSEAKEILKKEGGAATR